jgi:hypothetical protein
MGLFTLCAVAVLSAQNALDESSLVLVVNHQGYDGDNPDILHTIQYTEEAAEAAMAGLGIRRTSRVVEAESAGGISLERIVARCQEAGVRWALAVYTDFRNGRFSWRFSVYDAVEGFIRASDIFSAYLSAGITSLNTIDSSAGRIVLNWQKSYPAQAFDGRFAVTISQKFRSRQEGAEVFYGDAGGIPLGRIEVGVLDAAFYPFTAGLPVYGVVVKDGYWPRTFTLPQGITEEVFSLPILQRKTRHSLGLVTGFRGPNFYTADFEYRFHALPDRLFLKAAWGMRLDSTALSQDLSPEIPAVHHELRFSPGLYLLPFTDFPVRILAGTGISLELTEGGTNFLADPLWVALEYHFPLWALVAELRLPKIFGYSRGAFQENKLGDALWYSFGVVLKW